MKAILFLGIAACILLIAVFAFRSISLQTPSATPNIEVTLSGVLTAVPQTSEYAYVIKSQTSTVGVNSMKIDLSKFNNKKVTIQGQYSGTVLYADTVTETP